MNAYVIIGRGDSGKSSITRALTGSGSGEIRTRPISTTDPHNPTIDVYVHLTSLQEDKRVTGPADFVRRVNKEKCDAIIFSLWPQGRGGQNKRPDADAYLRYFEGVAEWNVVKVACLGGSRQRITTSFPKGVVDDFPAVTPPKEKPSTTANEVAARVRKHFGWK